MKWKEGREGGSEEGRKGKEKEVYRKRRRKGEKQTWLRLQNTGNQKRRSEKKGEET